MPPILPAGAVRRGFGAHELSPIKVSGPRDSRPGATALPPDRGDARSQAFGIEELFWAIREAAVVAEASTGRVMLWNPAAEAMFGYPRAEAVTLTVDALVPAALKPRHFNSISHYAVTGQGPIISSGRPVELPAVRKDGSEIYVEVSLSPIGGGPAGERYVLAIIREVTHRRKAEADSRRDERRAAVLAETEAAMERSAALARAGELLVDGIEGEPPLAGVARLLVPHFADACFIDLVDLMSPGDNVQRVVSITAPGAKDGGAALQGAGNPHDSAELAEVLRTGEPLLRCGPAASDAGDATPERPAQTLLIVPMPARGRLLGAITLLRGDGGQAYTPADLVFTSQLGRTAALAVDNARLYREARTAIQVRDEFLFSASHELRTPITAIKAYAQLLQRRVSRLSSDEAAQLLEGLENIDDSASRLATYIGQLLDLSRLETGRALDLDRTPTDLVALARQAAAAHRRLSGRHRIRVKSEVPELTGLWDGARLERVLGNLLANAVKYSPEGGEVQVTLSLEPEPAPGVAVLSVRDQGIGIPQSDQPRVFERFYRGSNLSPRMNGLGIGLASVQEIVRRHGGSVEVESAAGHGSVFRIRLPLQLPDED
jgi:PAS domain S-box-containing protein